MESIDAIGMCKFFPVTIVVFIFTCAVTVDLKYRRIPNKITLTFIVGGVTCHSFSNGCEGLWFSIAGLLTGGGLLLFPFLRGGMGGGDVKLMAAVGAWLGAYDVLYIFIYGAILGGCYSLAVVFRKYGAAMGGLLTMEMIRKPAKDSRPQFELGTFPYAVPLALGFVMHLILEGVR